jgi:hypothetical protein
MKTTVIFLFLLAILLGTSSCKKKDVAPDGLSQDIRNFVPDSTLNQLKAMGFSLYEGRNPPDLEGIYLATPRTLYSTSVPDDSYAPGTRFADQKLKVYGQDNQTLQASLDFKEFGIQGGQLLGQSLGAGAFLAGTDASFTLFIKSEGYLLFNDNLDTARYTLLDVYSGKRTSNGIQEFNNALLMLDDHGDPYDQLIPVNTGRLFKDELAENQSTFRVGVNSGPGTGSFLADRPAGAAIR